MGSDSGSQTVTQRTDTTPWEPQQDFLKYGFQQAQDVYQSGVPQYFQDSTVIGYSPQTEWALRGIEDQALGGSPLYGTAQNTLQGVMGSQMPNQSWLSGAMNYSNPAMGQANQNIADANQSNPALGMVSNVYNQSNPYAQQMSNFLGGMSNPYIGALGGMAGASNPALQAAAGMSGGYSNPAMDYLNQSARGDYLNANPYMDEAYNNAARLATEQFNNQIAPGIDSTFSRYGRLGSNAYSEARNTAEDTIGRNLSEMAGNMSYQNYATERQNQLAAQNALGSLAGQQYRDQLSGVGMFGNMAAQDLARRAGALSQAGAMQQGQQGMQLSGLSQLGQMGAQDLARQLQAAGQYGGLSAQDFQNQLSATGQLGQLAGQNQALGLSAAQQYQSAYDQMLQRQLQGTAMAPTIADAQYGDWTRLAQVGAAREAKEGEYLADQINRWNFEQAAPWDRVGNYMGLVGGGYGSSSTGATTSPYHQNYGANFLSGAMGGGMMAPMMGINPMLGALGGGLLGLF